MIIIPQPKRLVPLVFAILLSSGARQFHVAAEPGIANLVSHAESLAHGDEMNRGRRAENEYYQHQRPYITQVPDSVDESDSRNRLFENQQHLKYDGPQHTFRHTFAFDDEQYLEEYRHKDSETEPTQVFETPFPAAEEGLGSDLKKTWKQVISKLIQQTFHIGNKGDENDVEISHDSSDEMFNKMDWSDYEQEIVVRFNWTNSRERAAFSKATRTLVLDVWRVDRHSGDVRLPSNRMSDLFKLLPKSMQTPEAFKVLISDLEHAIYNTFPRPESQLNLKDAFESLVEYKAEQAVCLMKNTKEALAKAEEWKAASLGLFHASSEMFFEDYRDLDTIYTWLRMLSETFPDQVMSEVIGQTHEGRDIKVYHLYSSKNDEGEKKKTIVLTSGIHAREWISVSSLLFLLYQLLMNKDKPAEDYFLNHLDFLIVPVMNPDGYVYTWKHDRLWRKNRQDTGVSICHGIDIDSSFNYHWSPSVGTPCGESYSGQAPLEALEAKHFSDYINRTSENHRYFGYIDLHSYSQSILYPYGYSCEEETRDRENLMELAYGLAKAIRWTSTKHYEVYPACEDRGYDIEEGSGGCVLDFMYKIHAIWAYQIKLRDTGIYGFLLPKRYIVPTGQEMYAAFKYFCDFILTR